MEELCSILFIIYLMMLVIVPQKVLKPSILENPSKVKLIRIMGAILVIIDIFTLVVEF